MRYRGAILDDYTDVARQVADWSKIPEVEFRTFTKPVGSTQELIKALQGVGVLCLMRERTLISRDVIQALLDLKIITPRHAQCGD